VCTFIRLCLHRLIAIDCFWNSLEFFLGLLVFSFFFLLSSFFFLLSSFFFLLLSSFFFLLSSSSFYRNKLSNNCGLIIPFDKILTFESLWWHTQEFQHEWYIHDRQRVEGRTVLNCAHTHYGWVFDGTPSRMTPTSTDTDALTCESCCILHPLLHPLLPLAPSLASSLASSLSRNR
jgi:hypothetical protein